jgi:hypothetical protein
VRGWRRARRWLSRLLLGVACAAGVVLVLAAAAAYGLLIYARTEAGRAEVRA